MHTRVVMLGLRKQPTGQLYSATAPASRDMKSGILISSVQSPPVGLGGTGHIPTVLKETINCVSKYIYTDKSTLNEACSRMCSCMYVNTITRCCF